LVVLCKNLFHEQGQKQLFDDCGSTALKHALEAGQKIEGAYEKAIVLGDISMTLATEPIPENKKDNPNHPVVRRMKKAFTFKEKQLAKQLAEAMYLL